MVSKVSENSPAQKAGLQVGDVIVKADGKRVESVRELSELIQDKEKGDTFEVEFLRDKKKKTVEVKIEEEERNRYFYFGRSYDDYQDILEEYNRNVGKQYDSLQEWYQDDFKKNMKKLNEDLRKIYEKVSDKSGEAAEGLKRILKKYKGEKV